MKSGLHASLCCPFHPPVPFHSPSCLKPASFYPVAWESILFLAKVINFLEYAKQSGAKYTLKTDDDTFVFVDRLLEELHHMPENCLYWGKSSHLPELAKYKMSGLEVPLNKWYIDPDHYP